VSLTPDDLPDPGEMSQVICACTGETFHFVITPTSVLAVCASCRRVNGQWPQSGQAQVVHMPPPEPAQHGPVPGCDGFHPPGPCPALRRETLPNAPPYVTAMWDPAPGGALPPVPDAAYPPGAVPLEPVKAAPAFSPEVANAVLEGGDHDGTLVAVLADTLVYIVAGYQGGQYERTSREIGGRVVFTLKPYPGMAAPG